MLVAVSLAICVSRGSDAVNEATLNAVNATGRMFIVHTVLSGSYTLRFAVGTPTTTDDHVRDAWALLQVRRVFGWLDGAHAGDFGVLGVVCLRVCVHASRKRLERSWPRLLLRQAREGWASLYPRLLAYGDHIQCNFCKEKGHRTL